MMSQHSFTPVELHFVCYNCHMINCLFCQQQTVNLIASHNFQGFSNIRFWQLPTFGTLPWTSSYWFHHLESLLCHLTAFTDNLSSEISPPTSACSVRFHFSFLTTQKQIRLRWITKTRSSLVRLTKCGCWCCLVCEYWIDIREGRTWYFGYPLAPSCSCYGTQINHEWLNENWKLLHHSLFQCSSGLYQ